MLTGASCGTIVAGAVVMKKNYFLFLMLMVAPGLASEALRAQEPGSKPEQNAPPAGAEAKTGQEYSGMYSFLKDGEFVQVTVEEAGHVTGFVSRFGNGESDKGAFLDQFFKSGKLEGSKLSFTTEVVHGIAYDFKGAVERGEGKNPGEEGYFVLKGTLTEIATDVNKRVSSHAREVALKMFPQDAAPVPVPRK